MATVDGGSIFMVVWMSTALSTEWRYAHCAVNGVDPAPPLSGPRPVDIIYNLLLSNVDLSAERIISFFVRQRSYHLDSHGYWGHPS